MWLRPLPMPRTEDTAAGASTGSGAVQAFEQSAIKATAKCAFWYPKMVCAHMNEALFGDCKSYGSILTRGLPFSLPEPTISASDGVTHTQATGRHMAGTPASPEAIRILSPTTDDQWSCADVLITELKELDVHASEAFGFTRDEVIDVFYPGEIGDIRRQSEPPDGCFLLAMDAARPVGCAAFRRLTSCACEAYDVYVRPTHRGRRIGSDLMRRLLGAARSAGYEAMCLETAMFMTVAHGLYRSLRFQAREPYRTIPTRFVAGTMWMECKLRE
jgi:GNAT superfamily N-acetyltransferase